MKNIYTAIAALLCGADSLIKYAIERNHPDGELRPALHNQKISQQGCHAESGCFQTTVNGSALSDFYRVHDGGICGDFGNQRQAYAQDRIVIDTGRSLQ